MGMVDGVAGATVKWEKGLGIPIELPHTEPSQQALVDFKDSILNSTKPISNITTGSKTSICVQMALDAMQKRQIIEY